MLLQDAQPLVCKIFKASDGIRSGSIALTKNGASFGHHSSATFLTGIPGSIAEYYRTPFSDATKRLAQSNCIVFRVMEGGIEYDSIELLVLKRQAFNLRPESRKKPGQVFLIMHGSSKTIAVVNEQVHCKRSVSGERQTKAHPAVSCTKIQNSSAAILRIFLQHMLDQTVIAARPDVPLFAVPSRNVLIRKTQIKILAFAATAFRRSYPLVVFHETCIARESLQRQGMHDSTADWHLKSA